MTVRRTRPLPGGALIAFVLLLLPGAAAAASPRVQTMVVGRSAVLEQAQSVTARPARLGGCPVAAATPLAVLVATRARVRLTDDGACSSSSLFVTQIGGERNRGQAGWVYKVGRRAGTTSAADPSGSFGTGRRLRSGDQVLWFWCRAALRCQRTLEVRAVLAGAGLIRATVRGYDDQGRGVPVAGATVAGGGAEATTDRDGIASLSYGPGLGPRITVTASRPGMIPSFPVRAASPARTR